MARNVALAHCFSDHTAEVRYLLVTSTGTGAVFDDLFNLSSWASGSLDLTSHVGKLTFAG